MKTYVWDVRNYVDDLSTYPQIDEIIQALKANEVIGIPTETVYGLAGNAMSDEAVDKIFKAKGRPSDNPLIVHIYEQEQIQAFAEIPNQTTEMLMDAFWPGPISFILPMKKDVLSKLSFGQMDTVAVRMPSDKVARQLLKLSYLPIAAPSANTSGKPSPTHAEHVINDLDGKIFGVVVSDPVEVGIESTVIDCTSYPFKIARPGAITQSMIESIVPGCIVPFNYDLKQPIAPGMKYRHYAPEAQLVKVGPFDTFKLQPDEAMIAPINEHHKVEGHVFPLGQSYNDITGAMRDLYHSLRSADQLEAIKVIYITDFEETDESMALLNRMNKAVSGK